MLVFDDGDGDEGWNNVFGKSLSLLLLKLFIDFELLLIKVLKRFEKEYMLYVLLFVGFILLFFVLMDLVFIFEILLDVEL